MKRAGRRLAGLLFAVLSVFIFSLCTNASTDRGSAYLVVFLIDNSGQVYVQNGTTAVVQVGNGDKESITGDGINFYKYWAPENVASWTPGTVITVSNIPIPEGYVEDVAYDKYTTTYTKELYEENKTSSYGVELPSISVYIHKEGEDIQISSMKGYSVEADMGNSPESTSVVVTDGYGNILSSNYYTVGFDTNIVGDRVEVTAKVTGRNGYSGSLRAWTTVSYSFTSAAGIAFTDGSSDTTDAVTLDTGKISSLTNTSTGIKIKWTAVDGADGYYIYRKTSSGSYSKIKTIKSGSTVSYTDKKVVDKNGTTYIYKVVPYSGSTKGTGTAKTTVRLTGTSLTSVKNSAAGKAKVKWMAVTSVTGYQIQYSTSKTFASGNKTKKVSGATSVSKSLSSLTVGKTYYVRIRTYKTVNGTTYYSAWSSKLKVKITK